jgi:hypothetical protein
MATTILHHHSWLGDDSLDLSELIFIFFMFLTWCDYNKGELPYGHSSASVGKGAV